MKRNFIAIDPELATKLRKYAFEKHGTVYGKIKIEAEEAIKKHIKGHKMTEKCLNIGGNVERTSENI